MAILRRPKIDGSAIDLDVCIPAFIIFCFYFSYEPVQKIAGIMCRRLITRGRRFRFIVCGIPRFFHALSDFAEIRPKNITYHA